MDSVKSKKSKSPMAQKTPKSAKKNDKSINKTPLPKNDTPRPPKKQNGVQTPNKKGNATPKKTPKTDPKKKKTPPKKVEESEDDDDEEDDSEIELNPELMKKLSEMQDDDDEEDMEEGDDDDDEEEDDDDEEEDDDDDDDGSEQSLDEDELRQLIESLKGKKSKKETSTEAAPKGGKKAAAAKPETKKTPKKESPKEAAKPDKKKEQPKEAKKSEAKKSEAEPVVPVDKDEYLKSVKERDSRTLFMKDLPIDIKEETILKLSKDIQSVRIRKRVRKDQRRTLCYAFLEFVSEAVAEKNFKVLSETKIDGKTVAVDYTGEKSLTRPSKQTVIKELDPSKLYITGFPYTTTELELKQLIPKAETVTLPIKRTENRPLGFAFAKFSDSEVCSQELKRLNGKLFKDCTLVALHANLSRKPKAVKRKTEDVKGKAKKIKLDKSKKEKEVVEEEEDEDDDEEEDDEDEEEDDDDSDEE